MCFGFIKIIQEERWFTEIKMSVQIHVGPTQRKIFYYLSKIDLQLGSFRSEMFLI
jgi:hypothetical protein